MYFILYIYYYELYMLHFMILFKYFIFYVYYHKIYHHKSNINLLLYQNMEVGGGRWGFVGLQSTDLYPLK